MITPKYTARIDTLWMCAGKCGVAIGAAYWPLLLIHSVVCRYFTKRGQAHRRAGMCEAPSGGCD